MRWFGLVYLNSIAEHETGYCIFHWTGVLAGSIMDGMFVLVVNPVSADFESGHMQSCGRQVCLLIPTAIAFLGRDKRP